MAGDVVAVGVADGRLGGAPLPPARVVVLDRDRPVGGAPIEPVKLTVLPLWSLRGEAFSETGPAAPAEAAEAVGVEGGGGAGVGSLAAFAGEKTIGWPSWRRSVVRELPAASIAVARSW